MKKKQRVKVTYTGPSDTGGTEELTRSLDEVTRTVTIVAPIEIKFAGSVIRRQVKVAVEFEED